MWKSELRNVKTNWEYVYLINRLRKEQNMSRVKMKSKNKNWKDLDSRKTFYQILWMQKVLAMIMTRIWRNFIGPEQKERKEDIRTGENLGSIKIEKQKTGIKGKDQDKAKRRAMKRATERIRTE